MDKILIVSNIILWVLVTGLSILLFALTRQIGVLFERVAPAGALMINKTLEVGVKAPQVDAEDINSGKHLVVGEPETGRSQLLFFMSPDCPVCKSLLSMLKSAKLAEESWLDIIYASDGELKTHQKYIKSQGLGDSVYVSSKLLGIQYGVSRLPFAVLIDEHGVIASHGLVNSREHIESLFESRESGIPSIQDYFDASVPTTGASEVRGEHYGLV